MTWTQNPEDISGSRIVEVKDAYETYYAAAAGVTEEEAVEAFVASYNFNECGSGEGLRAELQVRFLGH